jgi:hypothetical protein
MGNKLPVISNSGLGTGAGHSTYHRGVLSQEWLILLINVIMEAFAGIRETLWQFPI